MNETDNSTLNAALEDLSRFSKKNGLLATCASARLALMHYPSHAIPLFYSDPAEVPKPAGDEALAAYNLLLPFLRARAQLALKPAGAAHKEAPAPLDAPLAGRIAGILSGLMELGLVGQGHPRAAQAKPEPEPAMKPHPHAHILRYLADGGDLSQVEHIFPDGRTLPADWYELLRARHPGTYRIKPPTMEFNGKTLPMPEKVAPAKGTRYWVPDSLTEGLRFQIWNAHRCDLAYLKAGLVHLNCEAAQQWLVALTPFKS